MQCIIQRELLVADRRPWVHWLRWVYAGFVLAQVVPQFFVAESLSAWILLGGFSDFFERFIVLHFALITLFIPALVGDAITEEKSSGTLQYLLMAYLGPWEIVLGKLVVRTYQLVLLSLAGVPLIALFSGFGGVAGLPAALVAVSLALVFGLAAASILASVWCRHTRDALLTLYLLGLALLALRWLVTWPRLVALGDWFDPLRALALDGATLHWRRVGACVLAWSMLGFFCLALATLRLRGAYLRQLRHVARPASRWLTWRRPRIRANPVVWRERHVVGIAPWPWLRCWPRWAGCLVVAAMSLASFAWFLQKAAPANVNLVDLMRAGAWQEVRNVLRAAPRTDAVFYGHSLAALLIASLVVAVRASGCIANEREKETWQTLLQTPLTTRMIVRGKQWGILGACAPILAAYAAVALACSLFVGARATAWTLLGLVATVLAALYIVAIGIWCSARIRNSWQSLLATVALAYLSWIALSLPSAVIYMFALGLLEMVLGFFFWIGNVDLNADIVWVIGPQWAAIGLSFVAAFWLLTHRLLGAAERQINKRDRAREVDPQFDEFHAAWLHNIGLMAQAPRPIDPALLEQPLPLTPESDEEAPASPTPFEPADDSDALIPVPDALNPLQDYNQVT